MVSKYLKSWSERLIAVVLIISIVTPALYAPRFTPKAQAFWGIADTTVDVPFWVNRIIDGVSMVIAQKMIDHMVASTVKWAQSGFEGNPAYVTNPKEFFLGVADGAAGEFIMGSSIASTSLSFLCSPFQANIKLSLTSQYYEPEPFRCTLTGIGGNIEDFYGDFSQGGWDNWIEMTQNPSNNPYGAYLGAKIELDNKIAQALKVEETKLDWSQGFMSWSKCIKKDPKTGECLERDPNVETPGSVIKSQLDEVLPSGLKKLVGAQHIDQLISGFASGLLNKYVFGSKGLFAGKTKASASGSKARANDASSVSSNRTSQIDLDGDSIPDGQDADRDGALISSNDVCFHGGRGTPGSPCVNSKTVTTSPYFTPICQAIAEAEASLTDFTKYIDTHADQIEGGSSMAGQIIGGILQGGVGVVIGRIFGGGSADNFKNKADAELWGKRVSEVDSAIGEIVSAIQSRNSPYFDNLEIATNRFANYIGRVLESLIKDSDLDLKGGIIGGSGGGGLENLMKQSAYNLKYLREVKVKMGKCETPDAQATSAIPLPPPLDTAEANGGGDDGGGQCGAPLPPRSGSLPDGSSVVNAVANEFPQYLTNSCQSNGGTWQFMDEVVSRLHAQDPNWGYNGKRGDAGNLSQDAISYYGGSGSPGNGERDVHIVDIIGGHCGNNPRPAWQDVTEVTISCGVTGAYVYPR